MSTTVSQALHQYQNGTFLTGGAPSPGLTPTYDANAAGRADASANQAYEDSTNVLQNLGDAFGALVHEAWYGTVSAVEQGLQDARDAAEIRAAAGGNAALADKQIAAMSVDKAAIAARQVQDAAGSQPLSVLGTTVHDAIRHLLDGLTGNYVPGAPKPGLPDTILKYLLVSIAVLIVVIVLVAIFKD